MLTKIYVITWKEFEDGCMSVETPTNVPIARRKRVG